VITVGQALVGRALGSFRFIENHDSDPYFPPEYIIEPMSLAYDEPVVIDWPCDGRVTRPFHLSLKVHPVDGSLKPHHGVDIAAPKGSPVRAAIAGKVAFAGWVGGYGNTIILSHTGGVQTLYAHLDSFHVDEGAYVRFGDLIGRVGATGKVTGAHLHFEKRVAGHPVPPGIG